MLCTNALVTCSAQIPAQGTNSAEFQIGSRIPTGITYPTWHTNVAELLIGALIPTGITYPTWHANEADVACSAQNPAQGGQTPQSFKQDKARESPQELLIQYVMPAVREASGVQIYSPADDDSMF